VPKQYQKLNIKSQNDKVKCKNLPHSALCFLSFAFPGIATPSARIDRGGKFTLTLFLSHQGGFVSEVPFLPGF